jgi:hypothetical protein
MSSPSVPGRLSPFGLSLFAGSLEAALLRFDDTVEEEIELLRHFDGRPHLAALERGVVQQVIDRTDQGVKQMARN